MLKSEFKKVVMLKFSENIVLVKIYVNKNI